MIVSLYAHSQAHHHKGEYAMKLNKKLITVLAVAALMVFQTISVWAASSVFVSIKAETVLKIGGQVSVTCNMEGESKVSNGKLRIQYNPEELVLKDAKTGAALAGTMVQINDPLTGNKSPGEVVFVFANAVGIPASGEILELVFQAGQAFQSEKGAEVQVSVEEFGEDGTNLRVTSQNGIVYGETKDSNENTSQNGSNEDSSSDKNSEEDNSSKDTETNSEDRENEIVNTGDETNLMIPIVAATISLFVIVAILMGKKKQGERNE